MTEAWLDTESTSFQLQNIICHVVTNIDHTFFPPMNKKLYTMLIHIYQPLHSGRIWHKVTDGLRPWNKFQLFQGRSPSVKPFSHGDSPNYREKKNSRHKITLVKLTCD